MSRETLLMFTLVPADGAQLDESEAILVEYRGDAVSLVMSNGDRYVGDRIEMLAALDGHDPERQVWRAA